MFCECSPLEELNISNFFTNNVTNKSYMFSGCTHLKKIKLLYITLLFSYLKNLN